MDMKTFLKQATPDERESLASAVDSSVGYFYLIAGGHRKPGTELCKALVAAEPKLTLPELRPDIWSDAQSVTTLPYTIPNGGKSREAKAPLGRQPIDPKKELT